MASVSFSLTRGTEIETLAAGSQTVTEGTSAPGAGDLEVRINLVRNFTKLEIEQAMDTIWRFMSDPNRSTTIPL